MRNWESVRLESFTKRDASLYLLHSAYNPADFAYIYSIHLPTSRPVAIKIIDLEDSDDDISEIQLEINHLADCDSEWVTRYYGSFLKGWKLWIGESYSAQSGSVSETD